MSTRSTHKSRNLDSSKFTSSAAGTEAAADIIMSSGNVEDLEMLPRLAEGERKDNDYEEPASIWGNYK